MNCRALSLSVAALVILAAPGFAQEKAAPPATPEKPAAPSADQEMMMKKWAEYATPGENHKMLGKMVGNWTYVSKSWMDPSAPPSESSGKANFQMILGGRYLQENYSGQFMGQPFEGFGLVGYDNFKKAFVASWTDNAGTGIMLSNGTAGEKGDIVLTGTMDDPLTGQKDRKFREVMHWTGPDTFVYDMYESSGGPERKTMEITHTRVK